MSPGRLAFGPKMDSSESQLTKCMIVKPLSFFVNPKSTPIKSRVSTPKAFLFQRSDKNRSSNDFHENLKALLARSGGQLSPFPPLWTSIGFYHPRPSRNTNNKQWRPFFSAAGRQSELYSRDRAVATSKTCFKLSPTDSLSLCPPIRQKCLFLFADCRDIFCPFPTSGRLYLLSQRDNLGQVA